MEAVDSDPPGIRMNWIFCHFAGSCSAYGHAPNNALLTVRQVGHFEPILIIVFVVFLVVVLVGARIINRAIGRARGNRP